MKNCAIHRPFFVSGVVKEKPGKIRKKLEIFLISVFQWFMSIFCFTPTAKEKGAEIRKKQESFLNPLLPTIYDEFSLVRICLRKKPDFFGEKLENIK